MDTQPNIMNVQPYYREQEERAKRAKLYDAFGKARRVAGLDCSYVEDKIISGAVVVEMDTLKPVEKTYSVRKLDFPYVPGLLAYRESKAMVSAFKKLKSDTDILMIDGFGINHPRRCGIATYIGLKLKMPTIGVGKSFLCGEIQEDDYIYQDEERVGKLIFSAHSKKPVYVSPGHKISLDTSVEIVEKCMAGYRLPEPTRLAHEYVTILKTDLFKKHKE